MWLGHIWEHVVVITGVGPGMYPVEAKVTAGLPRSATKVTRWQGQEATLLSPAPNLMASDWGLRMQQDTCLSESDCTAAQT